MTYDPLEGWTAQPRVHFTKQSIQLKKDTILEDGERYLVAKIGNEFQAFLGQEDEGVFIYVSLEEAATFYRPVAPGTKLSDVNHARHVHDDGTYFHFSHATPEEHADYAARITVFCLGAFSPIIRARMLKVMEATNDVAQTQARLKVESMNRFANDVAGKAHETAMSKDLGYYHREQDDHKRDALVAAIDATLNDWKNKALTDSGYRVARSVVASAANDLRTAYSAASAVKPRTVLLAEAEAAKKAAAESETSDGDGQSGN